MHKLSTEQRRSLLWLSKQTGLMWGGIYDRGGNDGDVARLLSLGLIEGVAKELHVGKAVFTGGYRITAAGRAALGDAS